MKFPHASDPFPRTGDAVGTKGEAKRATPPGRYSSGSISTVPKIVPSAGLSELVAV